MKMLFLVLGGSINPVGCFEKESYARELAKILGENNHSVFPYSLDDDRYESVLNESTHYFRITVNDGFVGDVLEYKKYLGVPQGTFIWPDDKMGEEIFNEMNYPKNMLLDTVHICFDHETGYISHIFYLMAYSLEDAKKKAESLHDYIRRQSADFPRLKSIYNEYDEHKLDKKTVTVAYNIKTHKEVNYID